ncbi:FRG domain-containing protein [Carboxylicivirga sp. M1479]|uniref:FRG domain-containing protein n=1 Tax=Carboxylicivirga sp. M1479 TaxID=2594476 RepID=UPI00117870EC|nr:FRG domain-containing protein [Carboxylicivirga sp. M1479]TRX72585.1 FRG domain-containing protein [Carboxylicivirga sp. M1479]
MPLLRIESVSHALEFRYELGLTNSNFRFRGQADYSWTLMPSIYRYSNFNRFQTVVFEHNLLNSKPNHPIPPITNTNYDIEWIMLCQHYGVPTRLLDWSQDIHIALYFACCEKKFKHKDAALYICNNDDYNAYGSYEQDLMDVQELCFLDTCIKNPRMRTQSGSFMLWGHSPLQTDVTESYDLWDFYKQGKTESYIKKITIPRQFKTKILKELSNDYGIDYNSLYLKSTTFDKRIEFSKLKDRIQLQTLFTTDSSRLSIVDKRKARSYFNANVEDAYKGCIRLSSIKGRI